MSFKQVYSYDEFVNLTERIRKKYYIYAGCYDELYIRASGQIKNKLQIRSRKSIHNIDACPRPDLAYLVKEFEFEDSGFSEGKKQNSYTCYLNKQGRVIMTTVGITRFVEFGIFDEEGLYLPGYEQTEKGYMLKSIGFAGFKENNIIKNFSLMEILAEEPGGLRFTLFSEEYGYDDGGNLQNILFYSFDSDGDITVFDKTAEAKQLWYNENADGGVTANPSVIIRKFIYENGILKRATSKDLYGLKSKIFIHRIAE